MVTRKENEMKIGWNPVSNDWDRLYSTDFREPNRYDTDSTQSYAGRKTALDPNRHKKKYDWEVDEQKVYWSWEENS